MNNQEDMTDSMRYGLGQVFNRRRDEESWFWRLITDSDQTRHWWMAIAAEWERRQQMLENPEDHGDRNF